MWQRAIIEQRNVGFVRCCSTSPDENGRMSNVLSRFGLKPEEHALHPFKRIQAGKILAHLLWKDLAYDSEIMPHDKAITLAGLFIEDHSESGTKFYANADWSRKPTSYSGLTDATFDGGIIAVSDLMVSCVWVEDED
jgi:hypothetical protein